MAGSLRFCGHVGLCCAVLMVTFTAPPAAASRETPRVTVWTFDRLDRIGGFPTTVLGHPKVIKTPVGKAVEFNGINDALFVANHPLAGMSTFTFEALFRPDRGGAPEQRWFHLAERDPETGKDTDTRFLFEIRVIGDQWCLDAFVRTPRGSQALLDRNLLHPLGSWYHVAMVYDGMEFRSYVDGVVQGKAMIPFETEGPGHSSIGVRINKVDYFKGAVRQARFTPRALPPQEFMKLRKP
jgi:concanavalin A-like lectin/glucanase superfamily protein